VAGLPGLNAVIRGVVRAANKLDWEVIGFIDGYEGILAPVRYRVLDPKSTAGIMHLGGTILGTTNKGRFVAKKGHGEKASLDPSIIEQTKETLEGLNIEGLICIGGDGSLSTAQQLFEAGIPTIGVPKTIDNDIAATAITFGFDSAVACVVDSLDRLHTTAKSHKRVMVLEVMGRYAGWIALHGGLAGGADVILIPEIPFTFDAVAQFVKEREASGAFTTMVVVAEGACPKDGTLPLSPWAPKEKPNWEESVRFVAEKSPDKPGRILVRSYSDTCNAEETRPPWIGFWEPALVWPQLIWHGKEIRTYGQLPELPCRCSRDEGCHQPTEEHPA
jgi:6-phosphofructokinase